MEDNQSAMNTNPASTDAVNPAKLFVGNLTYSVNDDQLAELFGQYGELVEAKVLLERQYGRNSDRPPRSRGMGFVTFVNADDAAKAIEALHDQEYEGRPLVVAVAKPPRPREERQGGNRW